MRGLSLIIILLLLLLIFPANNTIHRVQEKNRYVLDPRNSGSKPIDTAKSSLQPITTQNKPRRREFRIMQSPTTINFEERTTLRRIDDTLYARHDQSIVFSLYALDNDGLKHINVTVNGSVWLRIIYVPESSGWGATALMWKDVTYCWENRSNYNYEIYVTIKLVLKGSVEEGIYHIEAVAIDVNNDTTSELPYYVENYTAYTINYFVFDYTSPTCIILDLNAINTMDGATKDITLIDPTDRAQFVISASDNYYLWNISISYTSDGISWEEGSIEFDGMNYIATIPPQHPGNITYKIVTEDAAGNLYEILDYYVVHDPYAPKIHNISYENTYVMEDIMVLLTVVENANSSLVEVNCSVYVSSDNISWIYFGDIDLEFIDYADISINETVNGELEVWDNATIWKLSLRFSSWTYVKVDLYIYDVGGHTIRKTVYFEVKKRPVRIIADNVTTRYGDWTNVDIGIIDGLNNSFISLYFELYQDDDLLYGGYSNSTGNTTLQLRFLKVGNFTLTIIVYETDQYAYVEKSIAVCVLKETIYLTIEEFGPIEIEGELPVDITIVDDENNIVHGCTTYIYVMVNGSWVLVAQETDNPLDKVVKLPIDLPNGEYDAMICVDGGQNYEDKNTTHILYVATTVFNIIYISDNLTLGDTFEALVTVSDPEGIYWVNTSLYDPYGIQHKTHYTTDPIPNGFRVTIQFNFTVHHYPGNWQLWITAIDNHGIVTTYKTGFTVNDVEIIITILSPENNSQCGDVVDIKVRVEYYGVGLATGEDVTVTVTAVESGVSINLEYDAGEGVFVGSLSLSGKNTLVVRAYDNVRETKIRIIVYAPEKRGFAIQPYVAGFCIGGILILIGLLVRRRRGERVERSSD